MGKIIYWDLRRAFKNKLTYGVLILLVAVNIAFAMKYNDLYKDVKSNVLWPVNNNIEAFQGQINYFKEIETIRPLDENEKNLVNMYEKRMESQIEKKEALIKGDNKRILASEIDALKESTKNKGFGSDEGSKYTYDRERISLLKYEYMYENNIKLIQGDEFYPSGLNLFMQISNKIYIILLPLVFVLFSSMSISGEFEEKTYKILFSYPIKKTKILLSKFLSSFIISSFIVILSFIIPLIVGTKITKLGDINYPVAIFNNNTLLPAQETFIIDYTSIEPMLRIVIKMFLYNFIVALFFTAIGILISSLFKNKIAPLAILGLGITSLYIFPDMIGVSDLLNPIVYANSYEFVTGIKTLYNPSLKIYLVVLLMLAFSITFIALSVLRVNKMNLVD
ncbi:MULTISPECIES: ABC transporter permease subunit [Clostridium]|uniref:ABC transporter permease n=1 Tax=Clostridium TaxID=1485 RepID=UPI0018997319|nr:MULTISPECIES: ABC transporter permease subunit [Clostridium]MDI9217643.1 ABC transporter permease [Clostridium tertium]